MANQTPLHFGLTLLFVALLTCAAHADGATFKVCPKSSPPDYPTIQSAVTAANAGDRIVVCPGIYTENVLVPPGKDHLSIIGQPCGAAKVVGSLSGSGFVIQSNYVELECLNIALFYQGVFVDGSVGAGYATLEHNVIQANLEGISFFNSEGNLVAYNSVSQNADNGVLDFSQAVWQSPEPNVYAGNSIQYNLANGIDIADPPPSSAAAKPSASATIALTRARVTNNKLNNNFADGLLLNFIGNVSVRQNTASFNGYDGIELINSSNNLVAGNITNSNGGNTSNCGIPQDGGNCAGIRVHSTSVNNVFNNNHARGNFVWDAQDNSAGAGTAGTANTWTGDRCPNDSPEGICTD